jgi:hypothetical protein
MVTCRNNSNKRVLPFPFLAMPFQGVVVAFNEDKNSAKHQQYLNKPYVTVTDYKNVEKYGMGNDN